ncbi:hypothetical protein LLB_0502 [Legionella longbeachae D-4968]|nr:hypothetical protein LLB_0502 [Legionella longbeachae D-4968]
MSHVCSQTHCPNHLIKKRYYFEVMNPNTNDIDNHSHLQKNVILVFNQIQVL